MWRKERDLHNIYNKQTNKQEEEEEEEQKTTTKQRAIAITEQKNKTNSHLNLNMTSSPIEIPYSSTNPPNSLRSFSVKTFV
jgi:hypothetical protein